MPDPVWEPPTVPSKQQDSLPKTSHPPRNKNATESSDLNPTSDCPASLLPVHDLNRSLPPKLSYKRGAAGVLSSDAAQEEPSVKICDEGEGERQKEAKESRLEASCIRGFAPPRKPRIGANYQAIVPDWIPPAMK
eukprot:gene16133-22277_t